MCSLELLDLLEETDQVTDWYMLGVYLKMPRDTLTDIEKRLSTPKASERKSGWRGTVVRAAKKLPY